MTTLIYKNAYKEVYTILQKLAEEDYNKIPTDIIEVFKYNSNDDYEFNFDSKLELKDQKLLKETRAILYNLYRDYLCKPWQREKIKKWQNEERIKNEKLKKQKYKADIFNKEYLNEIDYNFTNIKKEENTKLSNNQIIKYKENIFVKVLDFIKKIFKNKKK